MPRLKILSTENVPVYWLEGFTSNETLLPDTALVCPIGCPDGERIVPFGNTVLPLGKTVVVGAAVGVWIEFCRPVAQVWWA